LRSEKVMATFAGLGPVQWAWKRRGLRFEGLVVVAMVALWRRRGLLCLKVRSGT
jgi:hypothetical protein